MDLLTKHGRVTLTKEAHCSLSLAAAADDGVFRYLLAEIGVVAIQNPTGAVAVPIQRAYLDSHGYGPYDTSDL